MKNQLHAVERGIQQALDELSYDAFIEEAILVQPDMYDVFVSYDQSLARGHETVLLDPATETFRVQQSTSNRGISDWIAMKLKERVT